MIAKSIITVDFNDVMLVNSNPSDSVTANLRTKTEAIS